MRNFRQEAANDRIFMGEIDSPAPEIHGSAEVIQNFEASVPLKT